MISARPSSGAARVGLAASPRTSSPKPTGPRGRMTIVPSGGGASRRPCASSICFSISPDDALGLLGLAVGQQPPGALGDMMAQEDDRQAQRRADAEAQPPAQVRPEVRPDPAARCWPASRPPPHPERPVDRQVGPASHPAGDQLVDRRVDRRVFAADRRAGEEAEEGEAGEVPRERRQEGRDQVQPQRDREELLAAQAVGQVAEDQGADAPLPPGRPCSAGRSRVPLKCRVPGSWSTALNEAIIVTSRPSMIQVIPSAATTIQCHRLHGRRSSRAGTSERNVLAPSTPTAMLTLHPPHARTASSCSPRSLQRMQRTFRVRARATRIIARSSSLMARELLCATGGRKNHEDPFRDRGDPFG